MNLSPLLRLYLACAILGLFSLSAFIAHNHILLLFNQFGIAIVFWVRLIRPKIKKKRLENVKVMEVVTSTFLFVTTLTLGSFTHDDYKWLVIVTALVVTIVCFRFPFFKYKKR